MVDETEFDIMDADDESRSADNIREVFGASNVSSGLSEIGRLELWKYQFKDRIKIRTDLDGQQLMDCVDAELESWLDDDEWKHSTPEAAADENLSYWVD